MFIPIFQQFYDQRIETLTEIKDHDKNVKDMETSWPSPDSKQLHHKASELDYDDENINQHLQLANSGIVVKTEDDCEHLDIAESGHTSEMEEVKETTLFRNKHNYRNFISAPILILLAN